VILSKLEWAKEGQSERQIQDVASVLRIQHDTLDFEYIDRWVDSLGLLALWEKAKAAVEAGSTT
jgi:hypothetical protein